MRFTQAAADLFADLERRPAGRLVTRQPRFPPAPSGCHRKRPQAPLPPELGFFVEAEVDMTFCS
jgi:hypothetical protein